MHLRAKNRRKTAGYIRRMKKVAFHTLGCKVNQCDTEAISRLFEAEGWRVVDFADKADVYVINTCTVTGLSARKSRQAIRRAKAAGRDSIVIATGCYAQTEPGEVGNIPGVDIIIGTRDRSKILDYVREIERGREQVNAVCSVTEAKEYEELKAGSLREHTRAFVKIQEGCSQYCAYCIIPYARGPVRSRKPENVMAEVRELADSGFKEIVLTGIHLASYGIDIKGASLPDIIAKVHEVEGIERIRLGSIEPTTVKAEFVATAKSLKKLCPHFHISVQSGCDETLRRMNRRYTADDYRKAAGMLRENIADVALTTDVIVGFPGETDEEFEQTVKFMEEMSFARMHVFKYSPRKGTLAASFKEQVGPKVKEERSSRLLDLAARKTLEFNKKFEGRVMPVLFEQEASHMDGFVDGLTPNYIRVVCRGGAELKGKIINVRLDKAIEDYMAGTV